MKISGIILFLLFFSLTFTASGAEIFKWVDDEGLPHMTDRLDKVPKEYRDSVKVREAGKPDSISISNGEETLKKPDTRSKPPIDTTPRPYGGHSLDWWVESIANIEEKIKVMELQLESKKLVLGSHETTLDYSKDLTRQITDLKQRLKDTRGRKTDGDFTEEVKKKKIIYLTREIKKVRARKNANIVKTDTKDAIKTSEEEVKAIEKELEELRDKLRTTMTDARRAGVPQKHLYK